MYLGSLVNIRLHTLSNMDFLADFQNSGHVMESLVHEMPRFTYKEQLVKKFKERMEKRHVDNEVHMTIETKDGKIIGAIGLDFIFWKNGIGLMYQYVGDENYIDGGYSEEALKLFLEFAFNEGNVRKVKTQVLANDVKNLEALKANGFQVEVVHGEEVLKHGKYLDVLELALLRENYSK
ncbi:MAG: GNAT family N-acetyltransferase [Clostridia bacterium]